MVLRVRFAQSNARMCSGRSTSMESGWYHCACAQHMSATRVPHMSFLVCSGLMTEATSTHRMQDSHVSGISNKRRINQNIYVFMYV